MQEDMNPYSSPKHVGIEEKRRQRTETLWRAIGGLTVACISNVLVVVFRLTIFDLEEGVVVKPSMMDAGIGITVIIALILGIPFCVRAMVNSTLLSRFIGCCGIILCLTPLPLSYVLLHWFVSLNNVFLEP